MTISSMIEGAVFAAKEVKQLSDNVTVLVKVIQKM